VRAGETGRRREFGKDACLCKARRLPGGRQPRKVHGVAKPRELRDGSILFLAFPPRPAAPCRLGTAFAYNVRIVIGGPGKRLTTQWPEAKKRFPVGPGIRPGPRFITEERTDHHGRTPRPKTPRKQFNRRPRPPARRLPPPLPYPPPPKPARLPHPPRSAAPAQGRAKTRRFLSCSALFGSWFSPSPGSPSRRRCSAWSSGTVSLPVPQRPCPSRRASFKVGLSRTRTRTAKVVERIQGNQNAWIVAQMTVSIYALSTNLPRHLGCTPNWLEREQKFQMPLSRQRLQDLRLSTSKAPAPRPLERWGASASVTTAQIVVDKSKKFQYELKAVGITRNRSSRV